MIIGAITIKPMMERGGGLALMPHPIRLTVQEKPMSNRVNPVSHLGGGGGADSVLKGNFPS